ncbi:MAG TPA: hypothetical protein VK168_16245 [Saprospiraceae bacterium]|nr:hypothetical protein [Saprospiraceae bacterium]
MAEKEQFLARQENPQHALNNQNQAPKASFSFLGTNLVYHQWHTNISIIQVNKG